MKRGKREVKRTGLGRRFLSVFLAVVMCTSMLQVGAFATNAADVQEEKQILGGEDHEYYTWNPATNTYVQSATPLDAEVMNNPTDPKVTLSKTIEATGVENEFEITLQVKTKETIETSTVSPEAAVVLVIDASVSMDYCADCGENKTTYPHCTKCNYASNQHNRTNHSFNACTGTHDRMSVAKEAAIDFVRNYVGYQQNQDGTETYTPANASRWLSIVAYAKDSSRNNGAAHVVQSWVDLNAATQAGVDANLQTINGLINTIENGFSTNQGRYGTNTDAGLKLAQNLLDTSTGENADITSVDNKFLLLLSDGEPNANVNEDVSGYGVPNGYTLRTGSNSQYYNNPAYRANYIRNTLDTQFYSICFGAGSSVFNWMDSYSNKCVNADTSSELNLAFDELITLLKLSVDAWKVTDPMGQYMTLKSESLANYNNDVVAIGNSGFTWDLRNDPNARVLNDGTVVYELTYTVQLNTAASGFAEGTYYLTNGETKLAYFLTETENGTTKYLDDDGTPVEAKDALRYLHFNVPAVKGYLGDLSFTKVAQHNSEIGLAGAKFKLTHDVNCDCGFTVAEQTNESVDGGEVVFNNIPSGHTYILTETKAPDGYVESSKEYNVSVAYGEIVVTDGNTKVANAMTVPNELDPQLTQFTIEKRWVGDTTAANGITVTVNLYDSRDLENAVATLQIEGFGSATTAPLPTVDVVTGETIEYVAIEEENASYEQVGYSKTGTTYIITNLKNANKELTITKTWVGPESYKTSVDVDIYQDGILYDTVTVPVSGSVTKTVPTYKNDGVSEYVYTVAEKGLINGKYVDDEDGTTFSVAVNGMNITNTVDQQTVSVTGNKTWNISSWPENVEQPTATITLYANDEAVDTATVTAPATTYSFTELPKYALVGNKFADTVGTDGEEIEYTVAETATGSTAALEIESSVDRDGKNFTNTLTGTTSVTVTKTWVDEDESTRPATITINLLRNGTQYDSVELNAKTTYLQGEPIFGDVSEESGEAEILGYEQIAVEPETSYTFAGLPKYDAAGKEYTYTVTESPVSNYDTTVNGYDITNTLDGGEKTLTITKVWQDVSSKHDDVSFGIYTQEGQYGDAITLSENAWTTNVTVPVYDGGKTLNYYVRELDANGNPIDANGTYGENYTVTYANTGDNWTITNTIQQDQVSVSVEKLWNGGSDSARPGVTVKLMNGNTQVDTVNLPYATTVGEGESATTVTSWRYTFDGLNKYDYASDGTVTEINYTIQEEMTGDAALIARYENRQEVTGDMVEGYQIINNFDAGTTLVEGTKTWIAGGYSDEVTVALYADGVKIDSKETTELAYRFTDLPVYNADGSTIVYKIYELDADGNPIANGGVYAEKYTVTYDGNAITNKLSDLESKDITVPVNKIWNGPVPQNSGVSFTVTRASNGVADSVWSETITLTMEDAKEDNAKYWTGSLSGLAKYDASGYEYTYSVSEDGVDEAGQITIDGITYTSEAKAANTFVNTVVEPNTFSLSVEKQWADSADKTAQPAGITLQLLANGVMVDEISLPKRDAAEGEEWKHTFSDKPVYDANTHEEIVYTIKEVGETNGVIALHNNSQRYDVTYTEGETGVKVTNTLKDVDAYYYKVHRYYKSVINGVTTEYYDNDTAYTATEKGALGIDAMQWVDCATDNANTIYKFVGEATNVTQGSNGTYEFDVSDEGIVSFDVVKYESESTNYYYDVYLTYEYAYTSTGGNGGGGGGGGGTIIIPEPPVPLDPQPEPEVEIPEEDVPLVEIPEEEVPLVDVPKTGDASALWMLMSVLSGTGLAGVTFLGRKKKEEE